MGVRVESAFYEKSKFGVFMTYEKSKLNCECAKILCAIILQ